MEIIILSAIIIILIIALCVQGAKYQIQEQKLLESEKENEKHRKKALSYENKIEKLEEVINNIEKNK